MKKLGMAWFFTLVTLISILNADETKQKFIVSQDVLKQSVTDAHKGDYKLLDEMERAFRVPEKFVISKDLLPVYTELLKDGDFRVQQLGLTGIAYFKDPRSQSALVDYLKLKNPRQLEEQFNKLPRAEQENKDREYSHNMSTAALAVRILGEIADSSVIPFLESLRGIRDLKMEWEGIVVEKAIEKIKNRSKK